MAGKWNVGKNKRGTQLWSILIVFLFFPYSLYLSLAMGYAVFIRESVFTGWVYCWCSFRLFLFVRCSEMYFFTLILFISLLSPSHFALAVVIFFCIYSLLMYFFVCFLRLKPILSSPNNEEYCAAVVSTVDFLMCACACLCVCVRVCV